MRQAHLAFWYLVTACLWLVSCIYSSTIRSIHHLEHLSST